MPGAGLEKQIAPGNSTKTPPPGKAGKAARKKKKGAATSPGKRQWIMGRKRRKPETTAKDYEAPRRAQKQKKTPFRMWLRLGKGSWRKPQGTRR